MTVYKMRAEDLQAARERAGDPKSWPRADQLDQLRSGDGLRIDPDRIPDHETKAMCRAIVAGVKRLFEDPEVKADFEKWKAARQAAADPEEATQ